ncbi:MAG: SRPBCC domain-containing protein [Myxococcales bacterium]|nr:SRPBCC domain-containing protein [Myxococcales bacterium]
MKPADARASVKVAVSPADAFAVFTEEIDRWWRRGPRYRHGRGILAIEKGVGGRVFESFERDGQTVVVPLGHITVWEPPARFVYLWRNATFREDQETEVEVVFAPSGDGTLVTVTHRGWDAIPADHPARHGQDNATFCRGLGLFWGELLSALREQIARR